ncbi:hypothetical protein HM1_1350 [Heliomicrobium modesticaldum Ice1]|uniref:Uncharacterized protein n=1 Tax=Heliobacterium modesticaldum (strain ATCC 51547 / Ice1) TaxID=498761 RepID=B0TBT8_HELMI|nr:hypothetical protein HM1_1350 [Heliomicrobium modesticaldum Ice1]
MLSLEHIGQSQTQTVAKRRQVKDGFPHLALNDFPAVGAQLAVKVAVKQLF